ncbi:hypothetical protein LMG18102_00052 [Ralstonia mannitolilytica]|uniref:hypothetical protein n=1 Tax=Ralstonia mannitolilytica TaxID=105219 RepID=UPI0028F67564|nr:hypothetical protein [Ralstonia mannitolilytica]CAJ0683681.1 hypothetical protein LMG18102_00052 [Ralstonia mannitolilytica]
MATSSDKALEALCRQIEQHYKSGAHIVTGADAEAIRSGYYRYLVGCGKPETKLHSRIARSVYAQDGVHLALLRPALAELRGIAQHVR